MKKLANLIISHDCGERQETFDVRTHKRCSRCHKVKAREAFPRRSDSGDGLDYWCRACKREYDASHDDIRHHGRNVSRTRQAGGVVAEVVLRSVVFERDGWECWVCGEAVDPGREWPDPMSASTDHVVPISQGGSHAYSNVRLAHLGCNTRRSISQEVPA